MKQMNKEEAISSLNGLAQKARFIIQLKSNVRDEVGNLSEFLRGAFDFQYKYIRVHEEEEIFFFIIQDLPHLKDILTNQYPEGKWTHDNGCDLFILG